MMIDDEERDDTSLTYQLIQLLRLLEALNRLVLAYALVFLSCSSSLRFTVLAIVCQLQSL